MAGQGVSWQDRASVGRIGRELAGWRVFLCSDERGTPVWQVDVDIDVESLAEEQAVHPFRLQGAGCRVQGSGFRVQGAGCRVQGAGCRVQGAGCRVQGSGCRVQGPG